MNHLSSAKKKERHPSILRETLYAQATPPPSVIAAQQAVPHLPASSRDSQDAPSRWGGWSQDAVSESRPTFVDFDLWIRTLSKGKVVLSHQDPSVRPSSEAESGNSGRKLVSDGNSLLSEMPNPRRDCAPSCGGLVGGGGTGPTPLLNPTSLSRVSLWRSLGRDAKADRDFEPSF